MSTVHEAAVWRCHIALAKFWGDWHEGAEPYELLEFDHNMLMIGGVSNLWQYAMGNGVPTAGQALTYLLPTTAAIGVGDSTTPEANTHTDLQGTNKLRKGMASGYPDHTPGTTAGAQTIRFRSTFDTAEANFPWQEAAVFNSASAGVGRMFNRRVQAMGTKTSASSFQITFDISIA